ncbi:hypothetical protein TraAM80_02759 [Trypanosoma rangeli]|uniref:Pleckstrin homology domain-containing protein n=1 Tax=Trypanosoma rangeli TaxID=5698 RepID=A0A3R7NM85_TRYRA|nr:uncharacterized protein TraAM80_02759 [Trypanosoma rangeli]RNF08522.1 hypothetical protein TraAM80_02759 [Trypanosoma rangeli]|eukprot:RNF08522.1 hypothetical protein TraAM80_02759 [Trypanosoma rangeli]
MSLPTRRRSRAILAPHVLNPYEEDEEISAVHRKSRGLDAVSSAPPPPRRAPSGALRHQKVPSPIRVPRTRAPRPSKTVVRVDADAVSVSTVADPVTTVASSARDASCRETQRPCSAPSVQHTRHASLSTHDVDHRNAGTTRELSDVGSARRDGDDAAEAHPSQTEPQGHHWHTPFVVQSAVTQDNPFRTQTFEAFCCAPDYTAPADYRIYQGDNVASMGYQRTTEGELREQRVVDSYSLSRLGSTTFSLSKYLVVGAVLGTLQSGDWFYKWTQRGRVHERYVWLDVQRHSLLWGPSPRPAFIFLSHLRIELIIDVRPECMFDEATQRTFYRIFLVTEQRTVAFATEVRDKFDVWFDALQKIVLAHNSSRQWGQLWGSSSAGEAAAAEGRWISRCSPVHAVLHGNASIGQLAGNENAISHPRTQVLPSD